MYTDSHHCAMSDHHQQPPLNWEASGRCHPSTDFRHIATRGGDLFEERQIRMCQITSCPDHPPTERSMPAPPRNMPRSLPPHLPHELHLPPLNALPTPPDPAHHNDHQPFVQKDPQPSLQPPRLTSSSRLGLSSAANAKSRSRPRRFTTSPSHAVQLSDLAIKHEHLRT